jgi:putative DNA primase/helicase
VAGDYVSRAVRLSDVEARDLEWLWPNFLLVGEINLYSGEQGLGKSFMVNDLIARLTTGRPWPDGSRNLHGPSSCLMLLAEDDPATVIKPRQQAAGGNMQWISILPPVVTLANGGEEVVSLRDDLGMIEQELAQFVRNGCPPCRLIVVDPLSAFLGKTDGNDWTDTRIVTTKLAQFAQRNRIAVLIVHHFGKDTKRDGVTRSLGSTTFTAAARVFLTGYRDRDDAERRILYRDKSNVAPTGMAMAYRLGEPTGPLGQNIPVVWEPEPFPFDPRDNLVDGSDNKREERKKFLTGWLDQLTYPLPVASVYEQATKFGYSKKAVRSAAKELGLDSTNKGQFSGGYHFVRGADSADVALIDQTDRGEADTMVGSFSEPSAHEDTSPSVSWSEENPRTRKTSHHDDHDNHDQVVSEPTDQPTTEVTSKNTEKTPWSEVLRAPGKTSHHELRSVVESSEETSHHGQPLQSKAEPSARLHGAPGEHDEDPRRQPNPEEGPTTAVVLKNTGETPCSSWWEAAKKLPSMTQISQEN